MMAGCMVLAGCGGGTTPPLRVGMELAYPPFEMTNTEGTPTGVSVDLAKALGEDLGREVEIRNLAFDGLIPALKTGTIDLIISSMTATEERARSIDFSDPYVFTGLAILAKKDSGVNSIEDLNQAGRTVAVKLGTTGQVYAREHMTEVTQRALAEENACVLEVAQGKADGFLYDQMSVFRNAQRHPETTVALLAPFQREAWAIGIRKGNDELRREVNAFLKAHHERGGFERLGAAYLGDMQATFEERGIPFVFDAPAD